MVRLCSPAIRLDMAELLAIGAKRTATVYDGRVCKTLSQQRAASTTQVYINRFNNFRSYCFRLNRTIVLPLDCGTVLGWLQGFVDRGCTATTVVGNYEAVLWCAGVAGYDSLRGDSRMAAFLSGCKRACPALRAGSKVCWTVSMLQDLYIRHCERFADFCVLRNLVMINIAFYGFLRSSELLALRVPDFHFDADKLSISIARSKTDQAGFGVQIHIARAAHQFCPIALLERFLMKFEPTGYVFCSYRLQKPVTYGNFRRIVKGYAVQLGLDPAQFAPHSLRSGGCSYAARMGYSRSELAKHGRWASLQSVERYDQNETVMES